MYWPECIKTGPQLAGRHSILLRCVLGMGTILAATVAGRWMSSNPEILLFDPLRLDHLLVLGGILLSSALLFTKPEPGLLLLVALLYSNASEVAVRYHGLPSILQGLGLLLGLAVLGRWLSEPAEPLHFDASLLFLAAYCFVLFASSIHAANPSLADKKLMEHAKGLFTFVLVLNLVRSRVTLDRAVWTILLVGAALSTISAFQVFTSSYDLDFGGFARIKDAQIVGDLRQSRISGPCADPNFYAQILIPLIPLGMVRLWSEKSLWRKALGAYGTVACLCALVFTYSRGAVLALLVMLVVALPILRLRLKHCLLGISLLGLSIMLAPRQFEQRLATLAQFVNAKESSTNTDSSFRQRALLMRAAWEMWREHPFLGVGAGNYAEQYPDFANRVGSTVSSYEEFGEKRYAHSLYLEIGAETGLAGIVVFSAILCAAGICGWRAFRSYRRLRDLKMARLVVSLMIGMLGYLATSLFLHASYPRHLWLLLALVAASAQIARKAASSSEIGGTE